MTIQLYGKEKSVPTMSPDELTQTAARFKMLGEPMRLKILQSICHAPRTVNDIVAAVGSTQANGSKHLALLAAAGILKREKAGQCGYYGMKDKLVVQLCELVQAQLADWRTERTRRAACAHIIAPDFAVTFNA